MMSKGERSREKHRMSETERWTEDELKEYTNDRGTIDRVSLIGLTSMRKGDTFEDIVKYIFSLVLKIKDERAEY